MARESWNDNGVDMWAQDRDVEVVGSYGPNVRGELLSERPDGVRAYEDRWIDRRPKLIAIFLALVVVCALLPFYGFVDPEDFDAFFVMIIVVSVLLTALMMVGMFLMARMPLRALKVYEKGVLVETVRREQRYIPWGTFTQGFEMDNYRGRRLLMSSPVGLVTIPGEMPGYDDWQKDVEKRVGDDDYKAMDAGEAKARRRDLRRDLRTRLVAFLVGDAIATAGVYFSLFHDGGSVDVHLIVLLFVYVALIVVNMFMSWLLKPAAVEYYGHNAKRTAAVFVVLLIALYSGFTAGYMAYDSPLKEDALSITDTSEPAYGVLVPSTYEGMEVIADGPVLVGAGEVLQLVNTTLTFDPAPGMDWGLWVGEGGTLVVDNSTIKSSDPFEGFYIKVFGSATVVDSELEGICDNVMDVDRSFWDMYYEYGFEVRSDGFTMRGTTVRDALGTGLMLNGANATIEDCTFFRPGGSGIVTSDSDVTVTNCTFVGSDRGMNVWHSNVTIEGSTFRSLQNGVMLHYSSSEISGSAFEECHDTAVWSEGGEPFLQDNVFSGNGRDAYAYDAEFGDIDRYFEWVMVYMAPVMFLFFSIIEILGARLTKWWERRQEAKAEAMKGL